MSLPGRELRHHQPTAETLTCLVAARNCATAQRAGLAMVLCGMEPVLRSGTRTELRLSGRYRTTRSAREPLAILAHLDELFPGVLFDTDADRRGAQDRLVLRALAADQRLEDVINARNHRDLDIAIYLLRDAMLRIERCFDDPGALPDMCDAAVVPLIWRMELLDRHHRMHLCIGLNRIVGRAARIAHLPGAAPFLGAAAQAEFLGQLSARAILRLPDYEKPDWTPALGPAGRPQNTPVKFEKKTVTVTSANNFNALHGTPVSDRDDAAAGDSTGDALDAVAEKLRLIRITSQQRRYPGRATPRLPSRVAVIRLLSNVTAALYPRHYGPAGLDVEDADQFVGQALRAIRERLVGQLELEWLLQPDAAPEEISRRAHAAVESFMAGLPQIRDLHDTDINAAFQGDPSARSLDEIVLCFPGIAAILRHRIAHTLYGLGAPMLARIMAEFSHSQSGIDIHPGARIGPACFIDHGTGVVIGETSVIGRNVRIYQQVTLGAKRFESDGEGGVIKGLPRHPLVGDDVVIYAGATILGRVEIGKGAVIGGGVWLTDSVPPGAVVTQAKPSLNGA